MSYKEVKICLLGETQVGKSSIVHRFVFDTFNERIETTLGAAFLTKTVLFETTNYKFQIWDTAGQEKYRALAPMYYRGAAAAIVVYDITSQASFQKVKGWIEELRKHAEPNIILAIAGNKADLVDDREVPLEDAIKFAELCNAICIETSAKTAVNVSQLFYELCKRLDAAEVRIPRRYSDANTIQLSKNQQTRKRNCCVGRSSSSNVNKQNR